LGFFLAIAFSRVSFAKTAYLSILIWVVATLLAPGFMNLSGAAYKTWCQSNLKDIVLALHNYHDDYGCFPPAYVADEAGRPMHSWRVLILPYIGKQTLYDQYRFDEPWDGPNNRNLHGDRVRTYECPTQPFGGTPITSYVAVVGPTTIWPSAASAKQQDVRDGLSKTLMVVEMADSGIHWMEPRDLDASTIKLTGDPKNGRGISSHHRTESWSQRVYGVNVGMADSSVRLLPPKMPAEQLRALLTVSGGEEIDWSDLEW
jgi:hypothetical protein